MSSNLASCFLFFAWLRIVVITPSEVIAVSVTVTLLHLARIIQRFRKAVWAERAEVVSSCIAHRIYLWEWVGFCLSMTFSLVLVADTFALPAFWGLATLFLVLVGVPLAQVSMFRLREITNGKRHSPY